jgi:hypothetical protein
LASITRALLNKGFDCLNEVFTQSGIDPSQVSFALGVGGMASMPAIKNNMYELFRERFDVPENSDRLIAQGAAWVAHDRSSLVLARPLELRMPREKVFPLFQAGRRLPFNSAEEVTDIKTMYCADPKDGHANIPLVTTQSVLKNSDAYGKRLFLGALDVKVDSEKPPLFERINLRFAINQDLIFKVSAQSEIMNDLVEKEFYDLQFGIALPGFGGSNPDFDQVAFESSEEGLTFKADVVDVKDYKAIPGEILKDFDPRAFSPGMGVSPTAEQRAEKYSYEPCDRCGKIVGRCECHISNGR